MYKTKVSQKVKSPVTANKPPDDSYTQPFKFSFCRDIKIFDKLNILMRFSFFLLSFNLSLFQAVLAEEWTWGRVQIFPFKTHRMEPLIAQVTLPVQSRQNYRPKYSVTRNTLLCKQMVIFILYTLMHCAN